MNKYPKYKSSGVEWIGEIPEHWYLSKFKYTTDIYNGDSLNDQQKIDFESDDLEEIPYVSSKDIDVNYLTINYNNGLRIPKTNTKLKRGFKGGFLLCIEGGSSGKKMVFLEEDVCFVNKLCYFKSYNQNSKFLFYFIRGYNFQSQFYLSMTGLIGGVSVSTIKNFELPLPPHTEQQQIVHFLDEKTEVIDRLISTKERKINLLKQKRTSLINEVITKGLNPKVKMKDSGVEWIGEIPEHWKITPLKFLGDFQNGISKGSEYFGTGFPFMNYGDVYKNEITPNIVVGKVESTEHDRKQYSVVRGDIFFTRTSESKDDIGISSTCLTTISDCVFSGFVIRFRFHKETHLPEYSRNHFQTYWKKVFIESKMDIVTRSSLSQQVLGHVPVLIPPIKEQEQIVNHLDSLTKEMDDLVLMEQNKIDLLKEYRQSLISEVITGKIDVRTNPN
jgi:type I restriction enzyme S subunit